MKFLIRSAKTGDEQQLKKLSESFHLCSLPKDISSIQKKIQLSERSFAGTIPFRERVFLFVLEEKKTHRLVGSSQILACYIGQKIPHFTLDKKATSLRLHHIHSESVQLGGLVLLPEFRRGSDKLGRQIGASRFLYMLTDPQIWSEEVEVSLSAPLKDNDTTSEFWDAVGKKVFSLNYLEACELYQRDFPRFLSRVPQNITVDLKSLPEGARQAMEGIHPETLSLYRGLLKLGFKNTPYRHFLDGGVFLKIRWENIPFVAQGKKALLKQGEPDHPRPWLWGQQIKRKFIGGVIEGELKEDRSFLSKQPLPDDIMPSASLFVTPLNPLEKSAVPDR